MSSKPDQTDAVAPDETLVESVVEAVLEPVVEPPVPDERLLAAHDLALAALKEITPEPTIGEPAGYTVEADGVVSLRFENRLSGYPGWFWTVSVARTDDAEPTVLEAELLPGDGALLAPEWVPWAERLAEYQAAQAALAEAAGEDAADAEAAEDADDELDDVEDLDAADFDDDGSPILHAGDLDGVDIDVLDPDDSGDDEDDEDDAEEAEAEDADDVEDDAEEAEPEDADDVEDDEPDEDEPDDEDDEPDEPESDEDDGEPDDES